MITNQFTNCDQWSVIITRIPISITIMENNNDKSCLMIYWDWLIFCLTLKIWDHNWYQCIKYPVTAHNEPVCQVIQKSLFWPTQIQPFPHIHCFVVRWQTQNLFKSHKSSDNYWTYCFLSARTRHELFWAVIIKHGCVFIVAASGVLYL